MEIYVRVHDDGSGQIAWWNDNGDESYLMDGAELFAEGTYGGDDYFRGTPFKTFKDVKRAGSRAKYAMEYDGALGKVYVTYWRYRNGTLVETKFTKDGKIKKVN